MSSWIFISVIARSVFNDEAIFLAISSEASAIALQQELTMTI